MRRSTRIASAVFGLSLAVAGFAAPPGESADADIVLRPVKYADLGNLIRGSKGKVIIVDFWAEF
jgi:hypothetical protein